MMTKEEMINFLYVSLISADNDDYTEEIKQELISRYDEKPRDWEYILKPIDNPRVLELFKYLEKNND